MKIKNRLGLTVSVVLLSANTAIAQPKPTTSPQLVPSPTISTQQQKELEKLQQEKEIRDTVQAEVDRAFSRTTTMLNILLVVLTILPVGTAIIVWLLRRSVVSQLVTEIKEPIEKEISKAKVDAATQLQKLVSDTEQEMEDIKNQTTSELKILVSNLLIDTKQQLETEILQVKTDSTKQLQNIITESEDLFQRITQQIENAAQEIQARKYQTTSQIQNLTNQLVSESKTQLTREIEQAKTEGMAQLKNAEREIESRKNQTISQIQNSTNQLIAETTAQIRREIEKIKYDALNQINKMVFEVQQEKTRIIQQISQITPQTLVAQVAPEIKQEIQELTKQLKSLESNNPDLLLTADDYFNQGNALFFTGDYQGAIKSYDQAIQIKPFHEAWYNRGVVLINSDQYQDALTSFDKALEIKSDFYPALYNRGEVLVKITKYKDLFSGSFPGSIDLSDENKQQYLEAIASYDKALEIKPDLHQAWYNKAECYALIEEVNLAIENLQHAIQLNPEYRQKAKVDPDFDQIREDERFKNLIEG